jgi:GDPmannose 4,6-dehydratase
VTRKITIAAAKISLWLQEKLYIGNLDSLRDRWHAKDYVEAMRLMLQQEKPQDFVVASWEEHSVREFVNLAFSAVWINIEWRWNWVDEKWYNSQNWKCIIEVDPNYFRPTEVERLLWNPEKAKRELWWKPKYTFMELVNEMVSSDLEHFKKVKAMDN